MTYRINIQLSEQEFEALRTVSQVQLRHPRDHARYIIRSVLLGESPSQPEQQPAKNTGAIPANAGTVHLGTVQ